MTVRIDIDLDLDNDLDDEDRRRVPASCRPTVHPPVDESDKRLIWALVFGAVVVMVAWQVSVRTAPPYCEKQWQLNKASHAREMGEPEVVKRRYIDKCEQVIRSRARSSESP